MKTAKYLLRQYIFFLGTATIAATIFPMKPVDKWILPIILILVSYYVQRTIKNKKEQA